MTKPKLQFQSLGGSHGGSASWQPRRESRRFASQASSRLLAGVALRCRFPPPEILLRQSYTWKC
eukprot:1190078-Rhodomonas_salina.3